MKRDLRDTSLYKEVEELYCALRRPGSGLISDAADVSSNGTVAVFTGTLVESLNQDPVNRICAADLAAGDTRVLTFGPNSDRLPSLSPDACQVAFLSDRSALGNFQLYLLDLRTGAARCTSQVEGWVEYLHWSPDAQRILLGVAGHGADFAPAHGGAASRRAEDLPSWMPQVDTGEAEYQWRSAWVYEVASGRLRRINPSGMNVWEAVWCGNQAVAAIASPGPGEGLWFSARVHLLDVDKGTSRPLYAAPNELGSPAQLGWPSCSPSGRYLAVVEAICSDRWFVAGNLMLVDVGSGSVQKIDTLGVDITYAEWRSERHLLLVGHRKLDTVVGLFELDTIQFSEIWSSEAITSGGLFASACGIGESGDCVLVGESFERAPELAVIRQGEYRALKSFGSRDNQPLSALASAEAVRWPAPDGLEIEGWLLKPRGVAPYPLVMVIHGGPVWHWRPSWLGRRGAFLMLLKRGYALLLPNPRGSTGRGRDFVRRVVGDMGGADSQDLLSGIDYLVYKGIADRNRLGVTGLSYGGFMTCWLITQDARFAAAVALSPITHQVTEHLISNLGAWVRWFVSDDYRIPGGQYFQRSPLMYAHKAKTPTLLACGALDRCTPPEEAVQFYKALLENGVESILVTYPGEGHGVRHWPAVFDYTVRLVWWFEEHMGARIGTGRELRVPDNLA